MADAPTLSGEQIARLLEENQQLRDQRDQLKDEVKELKRLIFGSKKERFVAAAAQNQLSLLLGEDPALPAVPLTQTVQYERIVKQAVRKASRQLFPAHLLRVEVIIEPREDVSGVRKVGEEITEELDLKPASLFVKRYIRPRYVSRQETFHIAELPARVIDKGIPGPDCFLRSSATNSSPIFLSTARASAMSNSA